jgi:hypothetical protein
MGSGGEGEELRGVNDRLREVIAELRSNRERLQRVELAAPTPAAGEAPEEALRRVERELEAAREALAARGAEEERLRSRLVEIEREHRRVCDDYVAVQAQSSRVTSLFVALSRLHETLERREVVAAIQEVVVNVLGSEQLALFELGPEGRLRLVHSLGVDAARLAEVAAGEGPIGRAALGGTFVAGGATRSEDPELTACTPLRVGGCVIGVLAVWRLLGHKPFLDEADRELVELLSRHAGMALHAAALSERYAQGAA